MTAESSPDGFCPAEPRFVPGLQLAREFCAEVVRPLLAAHFPGLPYAATLLGPGSEVAGFDGPRSTDHDWGPRLQLFLRDEDAGHLAPAVTSMLTDRLPESFRGYPTAYPLTGEPAGTAGHHVTVTSLGTWAAGPVSRTAGQLGFDPRAEITLLDWLATPAQRLAEFTAGAVFHDEPGEVTSARARLAWYPRDVWLYVLACQWQRIEQEEPFPGRCAEAGDGLGSAVVTARLARDMMRLALLMHRRYPPYTKWLGTSFARLTETGQSPGAAGLGAALTGAVAAADWPSRQRYLADAGEALAAMHNHLGLTPPLDPSVRLFWDRPYQVIGAGRFAMIG